MKWKDYAEIGMRLDEALQARAIAARWRLLHDTRSAAGSAAAAHTQDEE